MTLWDELAQVEPEAWGRPQNDAWDRATNFIYTTPTYAGVLERCREAARRLQAPLEAVERYALHRWYNYHTHEAVLSLILAHPRARPHPDRRHPTVDFYLRDREGREVGFDLKLTGFPDRYPRSFSYAYRHPVHLMQWLYHHQSKERRHHRANRLFVVFYDRRDPRGAWALRRDRDRIAAAVERFLEQPH
ncbi:MAG: hypothetical protein D6759_12390, partial [Chloroflexi bacterium]